MKILCFEKADFPNTRSVIILDLVPPNMKFSQKELKPPSLA